MKVSLIGLKAIMGSSFCPKQAIAALTMSGFEVESSDALMPFSLDRVVVGQVRGWIQHPQADRLKVCQVDVGLESLLTIVCGASNVAVGIKVPVAMVGAVLPGLTINSAKIRGVVSHGMLCSFSELGLKGLPDLTDGLWVLSEDMPVGMLLRDALSLDDELWDIAVPPNRGDCLGLLGFATELHGILQAVEYMDSKSIAPRFLNFPPTPLVPIFPVVKPYEVFIEEKEVCPSYCARIIRGMNLNVKTPYWMQENLRRLGFRSIHPVVDVLHYVMLETGQPLHAFDLGFIQGNSIHVRYAKTGERITLLNGHEVTLSSEDLVVADSQQPLAMAGLMGSLASGVSSSTVDVFIESAYFKPEAVACMTRKYHPLTSEAAYRYERGVHPSDQKEALDRATELLLAIMGGQAEPMLIKVCDDWPSVSSIKLSMTSIERLLGFQLDELVLESLLSFLKCDWSRSCGEEGLCWDVRVPPYRADLRLEVDLIEEIARLYGYNRIPIVPVEGLIFTNDRLQQNSGAFAPSEALAHLGYCEVVTYSFVDPHLQKLLFPAMLPLSLSNPISELMAVMRTSLWPGLLSVYLYNKRRQQNDLRLFEYGTCFIPKGSHAHYQEQRKIAALLSGGVHPEQWAEAQRKSDFFDLKGDFELMWGSSIAADFRFLPSDMPALHPGQSATIVYKDRPIGYLGALHPQILKALEIKEPIYLFESEVTWYGSQRGWNIQEPSKFPSIRRDLAFVVDRSVLFCQLYDTVTSFCSDYDLSIHLFDYYEGEAILPHQKSLGMALTLCHSSRTLVDSEVDALMQKIVRSVEEQWGAILRR